MISWMQRHNKYLVITIWIATIAFIGAGFVGWGSVNFGSRASSVAKVGDIDISKVKYSFTYNQVYAQYAQKFGNKFDKKMAKELKLDKQVFSSLVKQALLLNLAKEYGIVVTDKEVALEIVNIDGFKDKTGQFNKSIYENFLKSRGLRAKDFENIVKDDLTIKKLTKLINVKPIDFEKEVIKNALSVADKIKYKVVTTNDINVSVDENEIKNFWQKNKLNYLTKTNYILDVLWVDGNDINATDSELEKFYKQNSFNYIDKDGKIKPFNDVKELVLKDYKLKKLKKIAAIKRSRFKKGKIKADETLTLDENDNKLTTEVWSSIKSAKVGDYLKPKIVNDKYVIIHINNIKKPEVMSYENAKELAKADLLKEKKKEELNKMAENLLKNSDSFDLEPKDFINLSKFQILPKLTPQDSMKAISTIFRSNKKVDKIEISDGIMVYKVVEQKIIEDKNNTIPNLDAQIAMIKNSELSNNLFKNLFKKYQVESYIKGF